jgi:hypothetical protein
MYATAQTGDLFMRDLHQDDIDAICSIYPEQGEETCPQPAINYYQQPEFAQNNTCLDDQGCQCRQFSITDEKPLHTLILFLFFSYAIFLRIKMKVSS